MDDKDGKTQPAGADTAALPFEESVGYQVRQTHRLLQRYGVTPGMWYFLRALWDRDGMTQRELSLVVGTMEPTTLTAIKAMERSGLVRRVKNADDRRKINIFLTRRGQALRAELMPLAKEVVGNAVANFSEEEKSALLNYLKAVQENLSERMEADMMTAK